VIQVLLAKLLLDSLGIKRFNSLGLIIGFLVKKCPNKIKLYSRFKTNILILPKKFYDFRIIKLFLKIWKALIKYFKMLHNLGFELKILELFLLNTTWF
jgi:hypothetical protein